MAFVLTHNSYGKSKVRLTKVVREGDRHELFEFDVAVQLEGGFEAAYSRGDNRMVVATDTIKNTVYVLAKEWSFSAVEGFAMLLAQHFVDTYGQVSQATVEIEQTSWRRITADGKPHAHAFVDAGRFKRFARAVATGKGQLLSGGVHDLAVIKTTGSAWQEFHSDRYRTLKDTADRILATTIDAEWTFDASAGSAFDAYFEQITSAILSTFATRFSLGAQETIQHMGEAALLACPAIESIRFTLPNQHRIPFNLEPFGLAFENDIYVSTDEPHGLIHGTIGRSRDAGGK
jgi:urate oxidase